MQKPNGTRSKISSLSESLIPLILIKLLSRRLVSLLILSGREQKVILNPPSLRHYCFSNLAMKSTLSANFLMAINTNIKQMGREKRKEWRFLSKLQRRGLLKKAIALISYRNSLAKTEEGLNYCLF